MMDRSLAAIRARATESTVWSADEGQVPQRISSVLWRAVRDREELLRLLDERPVIAAGDAINVPLLAWALHEACCDVSHHDRATQCSRRRTYEFMAETVARKYAEGSR